MPDARDHGAFVLSAILPDRRDLLAVASRSLTSEHFIDSSQAALFSLLQRYYDRTGGVLSESALEDLSRKIDSGRAQVYMETYLAFLETETSEEQFTWSVEQLREMLAERETDNAIVTAREILQRGAEVGGERMKGAEDARAYLSLSLGQIERQVTMQAAPEGDIRQEATRMLDDYAERKAIAESGQSRGILFGIENLDDKIGGLQRGEVVLIAGYSSDGKAQALSAPVLTPTGFRRMGDLQVGDQLCDTAGGVSRVTGVFPQGVRRIYRLDFSDGTWAEASDDHLWTVNRIMPVRERTDQGVVQVPTVVQRTYTTEQMIPMMSWKSLRPYLPEIAPVFFGASLPPEYVSPYVLGLLLGDGGFTGGSTRFSSADSELVAAVSDEKGFSVASVGGIDYRVNGARQRLLDSGVSLSRSESKKIPDPYLHASQENRLDLLQGLLDSDGWADKSGGARFVSTSRELADGVAFLARSLGLRSSLTFKGPRKYRHLGDQRLGREAFEVSIGYHPDLFRLSRKRDRLRPPMRKRRRVICAITYVRDEEAQCISVSAPDSLYITKDFVPTHNTTLLTQLAWDAVVEQGKNVVFFTTETLRDQVSRKVLARHSMHERFGLTAQGGINSYDIKNGTIPAALEGHYREVIADFTNNPDYGTFYIKQVPRGASLTYLEQSLASLHRKFPVDLVCMDYLALLAPERGRGSVREELASIMKDTKQVATSFGGGLGVPLVSPWQVSRAAREKAADVGKYTSASLSETAEATNTADIIVSIMAPIDNSERRVQSNVQVLKNRDGPTANDLAVQIDYGTSHFRGGTAFGGLQPTRATSSPAGGGDSLLDELIG